MNDARLDAFKRLVERHTRENTRTPELARASLVRQGLITEEGDLAPEYGGPPRDGGEDARARGRGCAKDPRKAYLSYLTAALRGYRKARAEVARCLQSGIGTAADADAAGIWRD